MPLIKHESSKERDKLIEKLLPKVPFTEQMVHQIKTVVAPFLVDLLEKELAIYRAFPKDNAKYNLKTFDPRSGSSCFMGQGFYSNGEGTFEKWYDAELELYRQRVGRIKHKVWGNCTLLEIWAADHFERHPEMVKAAFAWGHSKRKTLPPLVFEIIPFFQYSESGKYTRSEKEVAQEKANEEYIRDLGKKRTQPKKQRR